MKHKFINDTRITTSMNCLLTKDRELAKLKRSIFLAGQILNNARCKSHLDTKEFNKLREDWRELNKENITL